MTVAGSLTVLVLTSLGAAGIVVDAVGSSFRGVITGLSDFSFDILKVDGRLISASVRALVTGAAVSTESAFGGMEVALFFFLFDFVGVADELVVVVGEVCEAMVAYTVSVPVAIEVVSTAGIAAVALAVDCARSSDSVASNVVTNVVAVVFTISGALLALIFRVASRAFAFARLFARFSFFALARMSDEVVEVVVGASR
jgi:hypothetical protein